MTIDGHYEADFNWRQTRDSGLKNQLIGNRAVAAANMSLAAAIALIVAYLVIWFLCSLYQHELPVHRTITVEIKGQGLVLGNYDTTKWTNQTYMQFRGIPYAETTKGKQRFKAPIARLPWRYVLDATNYGRRCPVITTIAKLSAKELKHDLEDCLNLCVYTKNLNKSQPVMFYIYGGSFRNGTSSDHPPRYLLEKDIVLVVPHYRVGALGWASTRSAEMPGNAAVQDLMLALQWVQKHIRDFGGNPENVTIFSQSAGTAVTGALLLSPCTTKGLFTRVIIQSGSILAEWGINKKPLEQVERICKALGCRHCEQQTAAYQCLKGADVLKLLQVTKEEWFSPIVGDLHGVLPQMPIELLNSYTGSIPIMIGFTKHDGSFALASYYDALKKTIGNLNYVTVRQFAEGIMDMAHDTSRLTNNLLKRLFFSHDLLQSSNHRCAIPAYFDLTNLQFMKSPVVAFASKLSQLGNGNIYLYSFDYDGEHTRFGYELGNAHYPFNGGVHHSNDNIYLFSTHELNANDTEMAKKMVDLWTSFAMNGVPSTPSAPVILPMENENGPYFRINQKITIENDVLQEFTAIIDDPDNHKLLRENIKF